MRLRGRVAVLLPLRGKTWLVQVWHRRRHHLAQNLCAREITRRARMERCAAAAESYYEEQCGRGACQSRLVPLGRIRIAQRRDIASAVERLRLALRDVHGEPLQTRRRSEVS